MQLAELIARKHSLDKVMLTVFKANAPAVEFYKNLKYDLDESDPSNDNMPNATYEILSKVLPKPARFAEEMKA